MLFVIYINDMPECVDSTTYLFADDTKIFREIKSPNDEEILQNDLDELQKYLAIKVPSKQMQSADSFQ